VRFADLRVRQGRFKEAEQMLIGHEHDPYAVGPRAQLHLARGDVEYAATLLRRHLEQHGAGLRAAPVFTLLAEVEIAAGRVEAARAVAERLTAIAEQTAVPVLRAFAEYVAGITSAHKSAVGHLEAALAAFESVGLPLEEACTRLELGRRLSAATPDVAVAEARAALAIFDRLGAARQADAAAALLRTLGVRGRTGPKEFGLLPKREQEVLQLLGLGLTTRRSWRSGGTGTGVAPPCGAAGRHAVRDWVRALAVLPEPLPHRRALPVLHDRVGPS
jgi:hypothetical protein